MQRGDVLFFTKRDSIIDRVIVGTTLSRFVHVAIALDEYYYVEAVWPRVRISNIDTLQPDSIVSPEYGTNVLLATNTAIMHIGCTYDLPGVIGLGVGTVIPSWREAISTTTTDLNTTLKIQAVWCSELVAVCLRAAGIDVPEKISPATLAAYFHIEDTL
jgi:hypothetical protein